MRLWHQSLISKLDRQRLLGQHRECAALRGKGWGRKHATVDYVFTYSPAHLIAYHWLIIEEMERRGYHPDPIWKDPAYRGKALGYQPEWCDEDEALRIRFICAKNSETIFVEHDNKYLQDCLDNLKSKGVELL